MGKVVHLLATFDGRIGRAEWWLGVLIIAVANVGGGAMLNPAYFLGDVPQPAWPDTVWQMALIYPGTAVTVKRFNDTRRPAWLGYLFAPLTALMLVRPHFVLDLARLEPAVQLTIALPMLAYSVVAFIDNGFIRGTEGPNRFGPDPLAGKPA